MTDREEFKKAFVEALLARVPEDSRDPIEIDSLVSLLKIIVNRLLEPRRQVQLSQFLLEVEAYANEV